MVPNIISESLSFWTILCNTITWMVPSKIQMLFFISVVLLLLKIFIVHQKNWSKVFPLKTSQFKSSKDDQESYSNLKFKLSIICFSETWETDYDISKNYSFQLEGYNATHQVRKKSQRERDSSVCKQSS